MQGRTQAGLHFTSLAAQRAEARTPHRTLCPLVARRTSYRRLAPYFRRYRGVLVAGMVAVIASRALMVLAPRYLRGAVNLLRSGDESQFGEAVTRGWLFLAVTMGSGGLTYLMRYLLVGTSRRVERNLKRDLFAHVEHLPASAFDRLRTGDLLSRLTSDIEAVRFSFGPGIMYVASTLVLVP